MRWMIVACTALLVLLLSSPAFSYSLVGDWSDAINPNGPWSYNAGSTAIPIQTAQWPTFEFGSAQSAWAYGNFRGEFLPGWFRSAVNPNAVSSNGPYDWEIGDVVVHTADAIGISTYGQANVTWTSPIAGIYDVNGGLWAGRDIGRSNDWSLFYNDVLLVSGRVYSFDGYSRATPQTFSFNNLWIEQGGILKLEIFRTTNAEDFVGVNFNIDAHASAVPEPISAFLFGIGGVGMLLRKFCQKNV